MKQQSSYGKKIFGLVALVSVAVGMTASTALAEPASSVADRAGAFYVDPSVSGIERGLYAPAQSDNSLLRDRATDRGHLSPVTASTFSVDPQASGIERELYPGTIDQSILRDRSTDRGSVTNRAAVPGPVTGSVSGNGFDWVDAGIGAAGLFGVMLLGLVAAMGLRRTWHTPTSA